MLDEVREYEQYTMAAENFLAAGEGRDMAESTRRLKYATFLKNKFSGLERAMTIIARRHLFAAEENAATIEEARIPACREVLKAWCGFTHKAAPGTEKVADWLPRYLRQVFLKEALLDCSKLLRETENMEQRKEFLDVLEHISPADPLPALQKKIEHIPSLKGAANATKNQDLIKAVSQLLAAIKSLEELAQKQRYFNEALFNLDGKDGKGDNDFKKITYDKILANAFAQGPLKRRYLVSEKDPFAADIVRKYTKGSKKDGKPLLDKEKDLLLKTTAVYLMERNGQEYAVVNSTDIANWLLLKDYKFEEADLQKYRLTDSGEQLIESRLAAGNVKKLRLQPNWTSLFTIVAEEDLSAAEKRGGIFFRDLGTGKTLWDGKSMVYE